MSSELMSEFQRGSRPRSLADEEPAKDMSRVENVREWFSKKCTKKISTLFAPQDSLMPSSIKSVLVTPETVPEFIIPFTSSSSTSSPACSSRATAGSSRLRYASNDGILQSSHVEDYDAQLSQSSVSSLTSPRQSPVPMTWNLKLLSAPEDEASRRLTVSAPVSPCSSGASGGRRSKAKSTNATADGAEESFLLSTKLSDEEISSELEESVRRFTNVDPMSLAAISLPHFRKQTAFGFDTVTQLPHTRRKESLFFDSSAPSPLGSGLLAGGGLLSTHNNKLHKRSSPSSSTLHQRWFTTDVDVYHRILPDGNHVSMKTGTDNSSGAGRRRNDLPNIVAPLGVLPFYHPAFDLQNYAISNSPSIMPPTDSSPESTGGRTPGGYQPSWSDAERGTESPQHSHLAYVHQRLFDNQLTSSSFDESVDGVRQFQRRNSVEGRASLFSPAEDKQHRKSSCRSNPLTQLRCTTAVGTNERGRVKRAFSLSQSLSSLRVDSANGLPDSLLPYKRYDLGRILLTLRYNEPAKSLHVRLLGVETRMNNKGKSKSRGSSAATAAASAATTSSPVDSPSSSSSSSSATIFVRLCLMPGKEQLQTSAIWRPDDALDVDEEFVFSDIHARQLTLTSLRLKVFERRRNLKNTDDVIGETQVSLAHINVRQGSEHTTWLELHKKLKNTVSTADDVITLLC
jgi:hypothetical protein